MLLTSTHKNDSRVRFFKFLHDALTAEEGDINHSKLLIISSSKFSVRVVGRTDEQAGG